MSNKRIHTPVFFDINSSTICLPKIDTCITMPQLLFLGTSLGYFAYKVYKYNISQNQRKLAP